MIGECLMVSVGKAHSEVEARVRQIDEANPTITSRKDVLGGEPVFAGTRMSVRTVVTMLDDGAAGARVLRCYPKLSGRLLALVRISVVSNPAQDRPKNLGKRGLRLGSRPVIAGARSMAA
jgi:uncharacterized protein (DUF433 family)